MSGAQLVKYGNLFERNTTGKQVKCVTCNCWLPSSAEKFLESHVNGRKHKQQLEKIEKKNAKLKQSVYVKGFDSKIENIEEKLSEYFTEMKTEVVDVYVDKNSGSYAIIQFKDEASARKVLQPSQHLFHGTKLIVKERQITTKSNVAENLSDAVVGKSSEYLLPQALVGKLRTEENVTEQMKILQNFYKLKEEDNQLRKLICELIENVLEEVYPESKVKMFGSSINGLGVQGCDIDMTVLFQEEIENEDEVLSTIRDVLERFAPGCKNVTVVQTSKTCKLIKLYHIEGNLNIDISLNNRLALANTELLRSYMDMHPLILPLLFTLRTFLKCHNLIGKACHQISNYSATIIFLCYLQNELNFPCLQICEKHELEKNEIETWNCAFCKECKFDSGIIQENDLRSILQGFFTFMIHFDNVNNIISIHTTKMITRQQCKEEASSKGYSEILKSDRVLLVQDPFKHSHNITQNLSPEGFTKLKEIIKYVEEKIKIENNSLLEIFKPMEIIKPRMKQKQQRNRSNIYSINLPECKHSSCEKEFYCYNIIEKLLREDLRMHTCVEENLPSNKDENKPHILSKDSEAITVISEISNKKRKLSDNIAENNAAKKFKQDLKEENETKEESNKKEPSNENNVLIYHVKAYADTWTKRRKQRRLLNKIKTRDNELVNVTPNILDIEDKDSGIKLSECTESMEINPSHCSNTKSQELLNFKLTINQATKLQNVCKITLIPLDISKNLQDFQTFFAFFKKELVSLMK